MYEGKWGTWNYDQRIDASGARALQRADGQTGEGGGQAKKKGMDRHQERSRVGVRAAVMGDRQQTRISARREGIVLRSRHHDVLWPVGWLHEVPDI